MTPRIRPALVANAVFATALLTLTAAGDGTRPDGAAPAGQAREADTGPPAASPPGREAGAGDPAAGRVGNDPLTHAASDAQLAEAIGALLAGNDRVRLSVTAFDVTSGVAVGYGEDHFDTASIVKVDILAALLLQAQDQGRELTAEERALAEEMIRRSDNDAADALWRAIGGPAGLDAANQRLGLTSTRAGGWGTWGLTQTTSEDQVRLLRAVFGSDSVLRADSRALVRELMGSVVAEQSWGISAASEGDFALKNGWLPRSQTGLWDVNSVGRITVDGRPVLLAVVSDGHATQAAGVGVVESAARAAVAALNAAVEAG